MKLGEYGCESDSGKRWEWGIKKINVYCMKFSKIIEKIILKNLKSYFSELESNSHPNLKHNEQQYMCIKISD